MQTDRTLNGVIHRKIALDKCAKFVPRRGKLFYSQNFILDINTEIKELQQGETCNQSITQSCRKSEQKYKER
jgi:hypothetical protein